MAATDTIAEVADLGPVSAVSDRGYNFAWFAPAVTEVIDLGR